MLTVSDIGGCRELGPGGPKLPEGGLGPGIRSVLVLISGPAS